MKSDYNIALIGAGNVATHLGKAFARSGVSVRYVAARTIENAQNLANKLGAKAYINISDIPTDVDFVIISTSDTSVGDVAKMLKPSEAVVVHTSGSVEMSVLGKYHKRCGVLYPLQTFSKDVEVDIAKVPFFIEGDTEIGKLAHKISNNIYHADSQKRKALHVAGVLTSNFPIYLLQIAERALSAEGFPLEVVRPLIEVSIEKAFNVKPENALTGPARRGDLQTIRKHINSLSETDAEIYRIISNAILKQYHNEQHSIPN